MGIEFLQQGFSVPPYWESLPFFCQDNGKTSALTANHSDDHSFTESANDHVVPDHRL